jgi:uncharacterized membrane protein
MHQTSGRWKLGFALALSTAMLWGVLPIALKIALKSVDPTPSPGIDLPAPA